MSNQNIPAAAFVFHSRWGHPPIRVFPLASERYQQIHVGMGPSAHNNSDVFRMAAEFNTTQWSMVVLAGQSQAPHAGEALENLCCIYWTPIYAYVRRKGHSPHDAQDLTQEFFARLLQKKYLKLASPERGKFRSFLLKSLQHFLINEWVRGQAVKRGGA